MRGPSVPEFWRSPLRGPWLTSFLGTILGPLVGIALLTGLVSQGAYQSQFSHNGPFDPGGAFIPLISLPVGSPSWLYAVSQGTHITIGLIAIPLLLAKLWSVIPRLFAWPPARSPAMAIERAALALLVGGALFEFVTGVLDIQNFYPWGFNFVRAHYWGAWVFVVAMVVHIAVKLPVVSKAYRERGFLAPLRASLSDTLPEPPDPDGLAPVAPAAPTLSRRGLLALIGGGSALLAALNLGESVGGPLRATALLAPRGGSFGSGPDDFPVNKTALGAGVTPKLVGEGWRLTVRGPRTLVLDRAAVAQLPQHTCELTLGCVEGWATTQHWSGVRLADLAAAAGAAPGSALLVDSLQQGGAYRQATLGAEHVSDPQALLALRVNGAELSLDHGHPARVIAPGLPGVHCTKWVTRLTFLPA